MRRYAMAWAGLALLGACLAPSAPGGGMPRTLEDPIPFGEVRRALTLEYIRKHYDPSASSISIVPRMIIVHWTGSRTLESALATFRAERLRGRPELADAGAVNVSAHYLVGRDGTIHRLMPEDRMARHAIGLNRSAIGIENVGGPEAPLTEAQLAANVWLIRDLKARRPSLQYLIGHREYGAFRGSPLWEERDRTYFTGKQDPDPGFLARLREQVADLGLESSWREAARCPSAVPGERECRLVDPLR